MPDILDEAQFEEFVSKAPSRKLLEFTARQVWINFAQKKMRRANPSASSG